MTNFRAACRACFLLCVSLLVISAISTGTWAQTLYASSESRDQIFAIDTGTGSGRVVLDSSSGLVSTPEGLAYDPATGILYIANAGPVIVGAPGGSITQFNTRTGTATLFAKATADFDGPQGLAFDAAGNLFATGLNSGTIVQFARTGGTLSTTAAVFATGLSSPYYLAFDSSGGLFVANPGNAEIRRYSAANTFTTFSVGDGAGPNTAPDGPIGLAFNGGTLYASDTINNNIAGFTSADSDLSSRTNANFTLPTSGTTLNAPQALAFDNSRNALYVSNFGSDTNPGNIVSIDATTGAATVLFSNIVGPSGLALAVPEPPTGLLCLGGMGGAMAAVPFVRQRRRRAG